MPLFVHQSQNASKSDCNFKASETEQIVLYNLASSAKSRIFVCFSEEEILFMYNRNNRGEMWSPCGTPDVIEIGFEKKSLYFTI